jgi:hypothetical protein
VGAVEELAACDPGRDLNLLSSPLAPRLRHCPPAARLRQAQQAFEPSPVEADDDVAVDRRHRCCLVSEPLKIGQGSRVLADVPVRERDPSLRKKLFLSLAARSAGLGVNHDVLRHHAPLVIGAVRTQMEGYQMMYSLACHGLMTVINGRSS